MKMFFNQVDFNCSDMNELYNDITVDISSNCICDNAIKLLKSGNNVGFDGLTLDYLLNVSPLLY